jgi:hypothetical protein
VHHRRSFAPVAAKLGTTQDQDELIGRLLPE